jgi:hypothetical protein
MALSWTISEQNCAVIEVHELLAEMIQSYQQTVTPEIS